jgi:hypothetical protein
LPFGQVSRERVGHRLRLGFQELFHPTVQFGVVAAGVIQITGSIRCCLLVHRSKEDRLDLGWVDMASFQFRMVL